MVKWSNLLEVASIVVGYLLGSFPAAYIVAKYRKGIDIRDVGVRNMGGANVIREVGKWEGVLTLVLDMGKGAASVYIAQLMGVSLPWVLAAGFAAMLGHNYPVYIGFRGGKGVATVMGVFFVLSPLAMGITTLIIGAFLLFARSFFVAVEMASPFFLIMIWYVEGVGPMFYCTVAIVAFQLFRSRGRLKEIKKLITKIPKRERTSNED
jgi:glycerol-3-phosphate acyltransferase PlsY